MVARALGLGREELLIEYMKSVWEKNLSQARGSCANLVVFEGLGQFCTHRRIQQNRGFRQSFEVCG